MQLTGETICLEVTPDMTLWSLKEHLKEQLWEDEPTRRTTRVDLVIGDSKLIGNDGMVADAGLSADSDVTLICKS